MELATQLLLWLWLFGSGYLITRRVLKTGDPWLLIGASVPVSMLCVLGIFFPLARLMGHPRGWVLGALILFVATMILLARRKSHQAEELKSFGFSPFQWACFMTLLTAANLVMHTREAIGPASDYWIHFPLISLLNRGEFPPPNPFLTTSPFTGTSGATIWWLS